MPRFTRGVVHFQNEVFPEKKDFFENISRTHRPEALFITCSDARIEVAMLTQSQPGDLFICRNAGNIVPPHTEHTGAMTASIEYAVSALRVPNIVVCGHTNCGAMQGVMDPGQLEGLPHVRQWLGHVQGALDAVEKSACCAAPEARLAMLVEKNVVLQLEHLKTHPTVAASLAAGELQLHGWVYDVESGRVSAYDETIGAFVPVGDRYDSE